MSTLAAPGAPRVSDTVVCHLKQRRQLFYKNEFILYKNKLVWQRTGIEGKHRTVIKFMDLNFEKTETLSVHQGCHWTWLFRPCILSGIAGLILILLGEEFGIALALLAVALWLFFYGLRKDIYVIPQDEKKSPVVIYRNRPRGNKVKEFMAATRAQARTYLLAEYGEVNKLLPVTIQASRLRWLYERGYMTRDEYHKKMAWLRFNCED